MGDCWNFSEESSCFRDLRAAKIKVRGTEGGFLKSEMSIQLSEGKFDIKIEVDYFDLVAYEQYERQSYAQVVINGNKFRAGWGNSRISRIQVGEDGFNKQPISGEKNFPVHRNFLESDVVRMSEFKSVCWGIRR